MKTLFKYFNLSNKILILIIQINKYHVNQIQFQSIDELTNYRTLNALDIT